MSDFDPNYPSTETITALLNKALFCIFGGLVLFILAKIGAGKIVIAFTAGGIICAVGVGWLAANNPVNKKTGAMMLGVGLLVALSGVKVSIFPVITGITLSIISVGLLVKGVITLFQYFAAQRGR